MNKELNKALEVAKTAVFLNSDAAFLGPLMCSLNFQWKEDIPTARTNGVDIQFNPSWFLGLPKETRKTIILHELWHVARLHNIRGEGKKSVAWNVASDGRINNDLKRDGYSFKGTDPVLDPDWDSPEKLSEEQIYELIKDKYPEDDSYDKDLDAPSKDIKSQQINIVSSALQSAKIAGNVPQDVRYTLERFTHPKINWRVILEKFFQELIKEDYSYKRPNRRYPDIYLPSLENQERKLSHIMFFLDTSGSMTNEQLVQFNTELKYIKNEYNPEKLTVVQFDYSIHSIKTIAEDEEVKSLSVYGRGGTSYAEVADLIEEENPICAVIFTDLYAEPMRKPKCNSEILWIISGNTDKPPFGRYCYI